MKKHAYLITAYEGRQQLEQLLSLLDDERNDVYLQVDSKGTLPVDNLALNKSHLTILPSFPIYWGGYSFIQAILNLLRAASMNDYHYYHLVTGADLPLVSQDRVHAFLANSNLEHVDFMPGSQSFAHWKAAYYHVFVETRFYRKYWAYRMLGHSLVELQKAIGVDRSRSTNECYYHGSTYFSITHSFVEYVLAQQSWIKKTFHHTVACDEVFLQTLLVKSPFRQRIASEDSPRTGNLRYIDWNRSKNNSPHTFRMSDYEKLREASGNCLFARKFNRAVDHLIIDAIVDRIKKFGFL